MFIGPNSAGGPLPLIVQVGVNYRGPRDTTTLEAQAKAISAEYAQRPIHFSPISGEAVKLGAADGWIFDNTSRAGLTFYEVRLLAHNAARGHGFVLRTSTLRGSPKFEAERALLRKILLTFRPE